MFANPEKHVSQLLQCLSQGKGATGFLLGAGCPFSIKKTDHTPLVPDIAGLTKIVVEKLASESNADKYKKLIESLKQEIGRQPNVEELLSRLRGLINFAGGQQIAGMNKDELKVLEHRICVVIKDSVSQPLPVQNTPFHNLAAWIGTVEREKPVEIFTTNYDLLIEQSLEALQLPYFDGFVGAYRPFFDPYSIDHEILPVRWARLWKLHGSVNWRSEVNDGKMKVWRGDMDEGGELLIHPSHLKYEESRKMPYLAIMDRLRKFISSPSSTLIIAGYSFNDQHLNDTIIQGLQGSPSSTVITLLYGELSAYKAAVDLASHRSNLTLLAKDSCVVGTRLCQWEERKETPETSLPQGAVEWHSEGEQEQKLKSAFLLGDFVRFGNFLQAISGDRR